MKSSKALLEQDEVVVEVEIAVPPERVFQALTDAKQLFAWWGKEPSVELSVFEMDARPGGRWRFQCKPAAGAGHGTGSTGGAHRPVASRGEAYPPDRGGDRQRACKHFCTGRISVCNVSARLPPAFI